MTPLIIVAPVFVVALVVIIWRVLGARREKAARVAYVTVHGVTVLHPPKGSTAPSREEVERAIDDGLAVWQARYDRVADANGLPRATAGVKLKGVRLGWSAGPTVMYAGAPSDMAGASDAGWSEVALGDPPRVLPLVSHEVAGHQFLFALGYPRERHHEIMAAAGFHF